MMFTLINLLFFTCVLAVLLVHLFKQKKKSKKLTNWKIHWPESGLKEIYKDSFGNVWYAFDNPLKMPAYRGVNAETMINQADMCMDSSMLTKYINSIQDLLNTGRITTAYLQFERMKERANMLGEQTTLLNLAKSFFLLEGENPHKNTSEFDKKKEEIWANDSDARNFFLLSAFKIMNEVSEFSESDILNYLKKGLEEESV